MIKGIGVDIVDIDRMANIIEKRPRFLTRNFTADEILLFDDGKKHASIAGNFACKEAVSKVFGTGFTSFTLKDIEILRDEAGKPYVNLYNGASDLCQLMGIDRIWVTITHEKHYAVAQAIGESEV